MNAIEIEIDKDEDAFEDYLNEINGTVKVCGYNFDAGSAFKDLSPGGFRDEYANWSDENKAYECDACGEVFGDEDDAQNCCEDLDNDDFDSEFINTFETSEQAYLEEIGKHNELTAYFRTAYCDMVDLYQKDNRISERQADEFTFCGGA